MLALVCKRCFRCKKYYFRESSQAANGFLHGQDALKVLKKKYEE
jgi:hypothetical protein